MYFTRSKNAVDEKQNDFMTRLRPMSITRRTSQTNRSMEKVRPFCIFRHRFTNGLAFKKVLNYN